MSPIKMIKKAFNRGIYLSEKMENLALISKRVVFSLKH